MPQPRQVGPYRLLRRLGAGGMGTVFAGEHTETGAVHAVKVLSATDPTFQARFRREGLAQAAVDGHPNVLRVHSAGAEQGVAYLAMDLATGGDLQSRISRTGPLEPAEAANLVEALARGAAHLHAQGVVHRDLKPANVLFDEDGTPKLADFGVAAVGSSHSLTETGDLLGSPAYMAPEQARGDRAALGEPTDVYGLGAILYACLTGRPPHQGDSTFALLTAVAREDPPLPSSIRPEIPQVLEEICLRALAKAPGARPSAADLALDLAGWRSQAPDRGPARWSAWPAALVALVLGLAGVVWHAASGGGAPAETGASLSGPTRVEPSAGVDPSAPTWFARLHHRPPLPLPRGLSFGEEVGTYRNDRDRSVLVWIPRDAAEGGGFYIGKYEVTQAQYSRFEAVTGRRRGDFRQSVEDPQAPVRFLSAFDADAYCRWARVRLPSGQEWSLAAGARDGRTFPWGSQPGEAGKHYAYMPEGRLVVPPKVGSFPDGASPFGCLDMAGGVQEWLSDSGSRPGYRKAHGAHWGLPPQERAIDARVEVGEQVTASRIGFRVCRSAR